MIYPMPALLVGANVDDKPNFMACAWCGIVNSEPPMLSVSLRPARYTLRGIEQNMTFSVNVPTAEWIRETDYCGIVTGAEADKVEVCQFKVFYGQLNNAPLIEQCPVNLECTVEHVLELVSHKLIVGKIVETHVSEDCLTEGKPDVNKIKPFIYVRSATRQYQAFGEVLGRAHLIGEEINPSPC